MATAAKIAADYGFGARAPWAAFRASEYDMKERARLSGLFPQVNNEPMSNTLNALVKAFEKNAALGAILERRRVLEGRSQYVLQSQEAMDAVNRNLAPWARVGRAVEAKSARVAQRIAGVPDAADVMTGAADANTEGRWGTYTVGGSESSTRAPNTNEPSEFGSSTWHVSVGQGYPQRTLDGRLGKSTPQRIRQTRSVIGKGALSNTLVKNARANSLTKWRANSSG